jgi:hypothetical protein
MLDSREPPHGDFVAFVERIEREQLARAMQPHKLPHLSAGGKVVTEDVADNRPPALPATQATRVLQVLTARGKEGAAPRGAMIGVFLGAALLAFGLMAEGGIVLVLLGAALLWHNLRKLRREAGAANGSPAQQIDGAFGQKGSGPKDNLSA